MIRTDIIIWKKISGKKFLETIKRRDTFFISSHVFHFSRYKKSLPQWKFLERTNKCKEWFNICWYSFLKVSLIWVFSYKKNLKLKYMFKICFVFSKIQITFWFLDKIERVIPAPFCGSSCSFWVRLGCLLWCIWLCAYRQWFTVVLRLKKQRDFFLIIFFLYI